LEQFEIFEHKNDYLEKTAWQQSEQKDLKEQKNNCQSDGIEKTDFSPPAGPMLALGYGYGYDCLLISHKQPRFED
jgi:hypothetical protein